MINRLYYGFKNQIVNINHAGNKYKE